MADDLGTERAEVHAKAGEILRFWFGECSPDQHFAGDPALDADIAARFGGMLDRARAGDTREWQQDPETALAGVILLDQFSRNIHRGTAGAFATDSLAQRLARFAIARGWDMALPPERRCFLYMPLMHAEDLDLQTESVDRFTALGDANNLRYAREHRDVIMRFGRFPSRNAALGRDSTAAELEYLSQPGAGW